MAVLAVLSLLYFGDATTALYVDQTKGQKDVRKAAQDSGMREVALSQSSESGCACERISGTACELTGGDHCLAANLDCAADALAHLADPPRTACAEPFVRGSPVVNPEGALFNGPGGNFDTTPAYPTCVDLDGWVDTSGTGCIKSTISCPINDQSCLNQQLSDCYKKDSNGDVQEPKLFRVSTTGVNSEGACCLCGKRGLFNSAAGGSTGTLGASDTKASSNALERQIDLFVSPDTSPRLPTSAQFSGVDGATKDLGGNIGIAASVNKNEDVAPPYTPPLENLPPNPEEIPEQDKRDRVF